MLSEIIKTHWVNPRRKRFWVMVLILLYTLLGFFAAPRLIENKVIGLFHDDLGRVARIEKVEVNPLALSLRVQGFEVFDTDDVKLYFCESTDTWGSELAAFTTGAALPGSCTTDDYFWDSSVYFPEQTVMKCTSTNVWTSQVRRGYRCIDTDTWEAYRNGFSNGYIQYMTSSQKSLVHFDSTMWGAIVYLTDSNSY